MDKSQQKALDNWEKIIRKALETGKGEYRDDLVSHLHNWLKLIEIIKSGNNKKARKYWKNLNEYQIEYTPKEIVDIFETEEQ